MREIKFRAWCQDKMDYNPRGDECLSQGTPINHLFTEISQEFSGKLMQYTGLKDKNGKEIYEGDIGFIGNKTAPANGERQCKVTFREGSFALEGLTENRLWYLYELERNNFYFKITGNIYENPELLNK